MDLSSTFSSLVDGEATSGEKKEEESIAKVITVDAATGGEASSPSPSHVVVMCGSTDWASAVKGAAGKMKQKATGAKGEEFNAPTRVGGPLAKQRVKCLGVGPCAGHCAALTADGKVFMWGLNANGQLGLGPGAASVVPGPTLAPLWNSAAEGGAPIKCAVGKNHTLVCYQGGEVASAGCGSRGALGYGERKGDLVETSPKPTIVGGLSKHAIVDCAAGADFSLCVDDGGSLYSFGWTEFGKLGQGSDGCYNTKDSSIKLTYTAAGSPSRVRVAAADDGDDKGGRKVVQVSAGKNHAACVCSDGVAFTWGDGAYGKLGHRAQEQLTTPTAIEGARFGVVLCGDNSTCGLGWPEYRGRAFAKPPGSDGLLYVWGVLKGTHGEGATRPQVEYDLQGWNIKPPNLAMGASHVALAADDAAVAWAQMPVAYGQLGYGPKGPKSSHKPKKVDALEGATCAQVVAAAGATHYLAATSDVVQKLPVWTPPDKHDDEDEGDDDDEAPSGGASKRKKPAAKKKAPAKKSKRGS
ncbi:hypothetical protein CTAYLR_000339 [Chrysophaeum taylorii]|uniref:Regulator of chromosome condensation n=1 Tax=Chrysophaeum taylorii TaxID=2483200 RepID=A0AAD7UGY7_9STRA|nr:hypothetical protein CTAYLR_000339 [Chrysophaeum taylorii]